MSIVPTPSSNRGDVILQPSYFTSSIYVTALRDDISTLILKYHEAFAAQPVVAKPFALFKAVWRSLGWPWLHFVVLDNRPRQAFLQVTARLFLEKMVKTEAPFMRVVALFGMYTFFYTQVKDAAPPLHYINNIPIPSDHYLSLLAIPESLTNPGFLVLQPHVQYILSCLQKDRIFFIVPKSDLGALNPRDLPREIIVDDDTAMSEDGQKRKGRPARREKAKKARLALDSLDEWATEVDDDEASQRRNEVVHQYKELKAAMLGGNGGLLSESVEEATRSVLGRLEEAQAQTNVEDGSVDMLKRVVAGNSKGIFGLM
ncbi:hypothetical protein CPC08DRAFT_815047 [Agrocybe pediades]|nr:hypothetical protein CPC08DRAFT_815047 [Agrocybe pediades]